MRFTYEGPTDEGTDTKDRYLCGCKHNKVSSGPFCDGSHKKIDWDNFFDKYEIDFNDDTKTEWLENTLYN